MAPSTSSDVSGNSYKAGRITQSTTGKVNEKANKVKGIFGRLPLPGASTTAAAPTVATRTFVAGEKLNVTKIDIKEPVSFSNFIPPMLTPIRTTGRPCCFR